MTNEYYCSAKKYLSTFHGAYINVRDIAISASLEKYTKLQECCCRNLETRYIVSRRMARLVRRIPFQNCFLASGWKRLLKAEPSADMHSQPGDWERVKTTINQQLFLSFFSPLSPYQADFIKAVTIT